MKPLLVLLLLCVGLAASAQPLDAAQERAERRRIDGERKQVEATYAQREQACRERFVVTSCLDDAKRERRQALERLRQQEAVLDEAQRKLRAAQRLEDIGSKVSGKDRERRDAALRAQRRERERSEALAREAAASAAASSADAPRPPPAAAPSSAARERALGAEAGRRVQERQAREAEAAKHRDAVVKRYLERAGGEKPPAGPLPVPGASAAR